MVFWVLVLSGTGLGVGPSAGESEGADLRITAATAQTFSSGNGSQAMLLEGEAVVRCGERRLMAEKGVIWITTRQGAGAGKKIYRITGYLQDEVKVQPKSLNKEGKGSKSGEGERSLVVLRPEENRKAVLFSLTITGKVYLTAATRRDEPGQEDPIYQKAIDLAARYSLELSPATAVKSSSVPKQKSSPPVRSRPKVSTSEPSKQIEPAAIPSAVGILEEREPAKKKTAAAQEKTVKKDKADKASEGGKAAPGVQGTEAERWAIPPRVYVQPLGHGKLQSIPQPDGTDIMIYTGGVYVYQRRPKQDALFELRAQNAVVFYSQKKILEPSDPNMIPEGSVLGQLVNGVYLEGDVVLESGNYQITADKLYYDFVLQRALVLDGVIRLVLPDPAMPLYLRAQKIRQLSENRFRAEQVKVSNDEFHQPHLWLGARRADVTAVDTKDKAAGPMEADQFNFELQDVTANLEDLPIFYWPGMTGDTFATPAATLKVKVGSSTYYLPLYDGQITTA